MFELLLQADRALSGGNLDQAERTYWQLSELDPTNAIAIAGLARVAMERGDIRLARIFAVRAQVMDPENVAATRIIETIDEITAGIPSESQPIPEDRTLNAARLLEAAGRARVPSDEEAVESEGDEAPLVVEAPEPEQPAAELPQSPAVDAQVAPQEEPEPASEPTPPDKHRFGRELSAAAAELEAGASDALRRKNGRHDFRFPPIAERGRRRFEPEEMRAPALADDPFAAAESEAVIEAVEAVDDIDDFTSAQAPTERQFEPASDEELAAESPVEPEVPLEGMPAENAADSVALRLATLGFESDPDVGDSTPVGREEPDDLLNLRMSLLGGEADLEAAEDDSSLGAEPEETEPESATTEDNLIATRIASLAGNEPESAELGAAEFEATATPALDVEPEAAVDVEAIVESEASAAADPASALPVDETDLELSEREAEAAALREAVAMVLEKEGAEAGPAAVQTPADAAAPADGAAPDSAREAASDKSGQEPRRRGFLRRIIGG